MILPVFTGHEAKTQSSRLLAQVGQGEEVIIAKGKAPVARIVPFATQGHRRPGRLKGGIALTPAVFESLPADETSAWGDD